jgi:hypothetical protein
MLKTQTLDQKEITMAKKEATKKKAARKQPMKKKAAKKKAAKKEAVRKAARKKKAKPAPLKQRTREIARRLENRRMPETTLPPPEELVEEYDVLADDGETVLQEMFKYDDEDEARECLDGEIQAWHNEREDFFDRAEQVWLELHPDTDPSSGDLDDWLGKKSLLMDIA